MRLIFFNTIMISFLISIFIMLFGIISMGKRKIYNYCLNYYIGFFIAIRLLVCVPISLPTTINNFEVQNKSETNETAEGLQSSEKKDTIEFIPKGEQSSYKRILVSGDIVDKIVEIWIAGFVIILAVKCLTYIRFHSYIKKVGVHVEDYIYCQFENIKRNMNCGVDVKLIKMKEIASPFVVGVLSKTIVIPDMDYTNKDLELEHIFKHELIHVKRHDNLYKLVLLISQSIHWFNPIVFFYFRIVERDLEYLCDRQVVQDEGKDYRKQYCNSILQMMENGQINKYKRTRIRCMSDFGQDKKILKERMRNILDKNKAKVKKTTIMIFLFIILIVTSLIIFNKENNSFMDKLGLLSSNSSTDQLEKYGIFEKFNGYSNLDIFPKTITESMNATRYIYRYKDEFLDPSAQIYLECEFDEESYDNELERLQNIYEEYKGINQKIVYDEKTFQYPAYVTINGNNHCYEYALLLGNNKIAYVFLQFIDIDNIEIPTEYLPSDYENINENGYSMYIFYREDGSGFGTF